MTPTEPSLLELLQRVARTAATGAPLRSFLRELVAAACELTGARYGALGVIAPDRRGLSDFVYVGISDEEAERIGHLPVGRGLLGEVIARPEPIRVPDMHAHPKYTGFPPNHPPMRTFLGMPLRIGHEVFGNFYLTEKAGGAAFTADDERVMEIFSAQAAVAVGYARIAEERGRKLETVLRQAPVGILVLERPEGRVLLANAAVERLVGQEVVAGAFPGPWRLARPDGRPPDPEALPWARALAGETVEEADWLVVRADGTSVPVRAGATPVEEEKASSVVVTLQDISPFRELDRLREEFAALVAHDLRNPITSLQMHLEMRLRKAKDGAVVVPVPVLERLRHICARLAGMCNDLLDASRIELGRLSLAPVGLQLAEAVPSVLEQMRPTLGAHPLELRVEGRPPPVQADPMRVAQIVTNLVENAVKYTPDPEPIRVVVAPSPDGGAVVVVEDRGPGIPPDEVPRLFERFYQVQRARAQKSGLGLGLYITKGLVDAMGGRITVDSEPGRGTRFTVWFPPAAEEPAYEHDAGR